MNNQHMEKLGKFCKIVKGKNPDLQQSYKQDFLPYLSARYLRGTAEAEYASVLDKKSVRVSADEIIIICDGSNSGETFYGFEGILSSTMAKLAINDGVDTEYLRFFLRSVVGDLAREKTGSAIPHLDIKALCEKSINLPVVEEQRRIVGILNESLNKVEKAKLSIEKNLQNSSELFDATLETFFDTCSFPGIKLEKMIQIKHGFTFKGEYFSNKGTYVLLTPGNFFEKGGYRNRGEKQKYYSGPIPEEYILNKDALLIAMTEQAPGLLGSPMLVPESGIFLHNQRLGLIQLKQEGLDKNFLYYLFNTQRVRGLIHKSASGVKVRHTSPSKVLEIGLTIPSLSVQRAMTEKLDYLQDRTKKLESIYQEKLALIEEFKKSILRKAFLGEL